MKREVGISNPDSVGKTLKNSCGKTENKSEGIQILPYTLIVGQEQQKLAIELAYIAEAIGGVLLSGQRGTGKSTIARAFTCMMYGCLPVTLPINATEDRIVGGWKIDELMEGRPVKQEGLLMKADGKILYIDEVNLLDDHIVNIILDVTSTGVLVVQRDNRDDDPVNIRFTLVGTMNPNEGSLRPQLLDRFGLMVNVEAETDSDKRAEILQTVLDFDEAKFHLKQGKLSPFLEKGRNQDRNYKIYLDNAKKLFNRIEIPKQIIKSCVVLANEFNVEGNRCDYILALATRAYAAIRYAHMNDLSNINKLEAIAADLEKVAPLVIQHRRPEFLETGRVLWSQEDKQKVAEILSNG